MKSVLVLWLEPKVYIATTFAKVEQNICLTGDSDTAVIGFKSNSCLPLLLCRKALNSRPCSGLIPLVAMKLFNLDLLDMTYMANFLMSIYKKCLVTKTTVSFNLVKKCYINL